MTEKKRAPGWKSTFNAVMKQHNGYTADGGKVVSYATQRQRRDVLLQGFRALRDMGFKFKTVRALRGAHIARLMAAWEQAGLSAATLQNRLSMFRTFSHWIGKAGMVRGAEHYVSDKDIVKRTYSAATPRSWSSQGIDTQNRIEAVRQAHWRFGDALALQLAFGLRSKESLLLRPHVADQGQVLLVTHGTKGGRSRYVPITTEEQRTLLEHLKTEITPGSSLVPKDKTYAQYRNAYYYVLRKHGISREEGLTAHGLRHEHLNTLYETTTGEKSPVHGGTLAKTNPALDTVGRAVVSERAGHAREAIAAAYIGGKGSPSPQED